MSVVVHKDPEFRRTSTDTYPEGRTATADVDSGMLAVYSDLDHSEVIAIYSRGNWTHVEIHTESETVEPDSVADEPTVWYADLTDIPEGVDAWSVDEVDEDIPWSGEGPDGDSYAHCGPFTTVRPSQRNTPPPGKEPRVWTDVKDIPDGVRFTDNDGDTWDGKYDGVIYYRRSTTPWSVVATNIHQPFTEVIEDYREDRESTSGESLTEVIE